MSNLLDNNEFISYAYSPVQNEKNIQRIVLPKKDKIVIYGTREIKVENLEFNKIIRKQKKSN